MNEHTDPAVAAFDAWSEAEDSPDPTARDAAWASLLDLTVENTALAHGKAMSVREAMNDMLAEIDKGDRVRPANGEGVRNLLLDAMRQARVAPADLLAERKARAQLQTRSTFNVEPGPRQWLVERWLPLGRIALLTGTGGRGKSRLALQLAAAIAGQTDGVWLQGSSAISVHHAFQAQPVVYVSWEDTLDELHWRLWDWPALERKDDNVAPDDLLAGRLHLVDAADRGPVFGPEFGRHIATRSRLTAFGRRVLDYTTQVKAKLLVLDPVAACYGGDENSRAHVREFMSVLDSFGRTHACTVLLIAHKAKSGDADYSGSTDWHSAARALCTMEFNSKFEMDMHARVATRVTMVAAGVSEKVADRVLAALKDEQAATLILKRGKANYSDTDIVTLDRDSWRWWRLDNGAQSGQGQGGTNFGGS